MPVTFDVVVIGAGINGAAVCAALTTAGYRVLLVDQGDIGSGTSQASTMLIWGGLLYLQNLEIATVIALSRDRDRLVAERPGSVQPRPLLYVPSRTRRSPLLVEGALAAYWMMGRRRRERPRRLATYAEQTALAAPGPAYAWEEAGLVSSDARFVLEWALEAERLGADVRNYVRVDTVEPDGAGWRVGLCDGLTGAMSEVRARLVVNAAGCWTDGVNARARITTPFRHVFSRGVSLAFARPPWHTRHLVFDSADGDVLTLAPWGPVSLWGSTDTLHPDLNEARQAAADDVARLLSELNAHLAQPLDADDVISLRTGVRPVPVRHDAPARMDNTGLTRHHRLHADATWPWISIYGGKLSGCTGLAAEVRDLVAQRIAPTGAPRRPATATPAAPVEPPVFTTFPTLSAPVVSAAWATVHEHVCRLDDYLRRRTNIAQWVPCGGFGLEAEHADTLERIALEIHDGDSRLADRDLTRYWNEVSTTEMLLQGTPASSRLTRPAASRWRRE